MAAILESSNPPPQSSTEELSKVEEWKPTRGVYLAFGALLILTAAVAIEATTLSVALPTMSNDLGGTALQAFWSGTSYLLASAVVQPSLSSLSDIFGRKLMMLISCAFFIAGSLVAALAGNFQVVLAGRTIMGVGGGGIILISEIVIADLIPLAKRAVFFSMMSTMWSVGTVTGPLIGAGFAQNVTWRWIFWINLPITGVGVVFVVFFLNQTKLPGNLVSKLLSFDWVGGVLFTAACTAFLFGLTTGGVMYEWASYQVLLSLILGVVGMVILGVWEHFYARQPMFEKGLFTQWTPIAVYIGVVLHGAVLWSLVYFLILYYQGAKLYSPITSALAELPETVSVAPSAALVGAIAGMTLRYRWAIWSGWTLTTMGAGLLYLLNPDTSVPQWIFLNIPIGIGTGMLFTSQILAIQAAVEPALNGAAAGFFSFLRVLGQSVGVAVAGVIFQNSFRRKLEAIPAFAPLATEYSRDATVVVSIIQAMPEGEEQYALRQAYADALKVIWLSMIGFAAVGLILSLTVKGYTMQQEHVSKQKLVEQRKDGVDLEGLVGAEKTN